MIHYETAKTYRNRSGNQFHFRKESDGCFSIRGELNYWRFGGQPYQEGVDTYNLGFVDPSGGPFLSAGDFSINGKVVQRIACVNTTSYDSLDNGIRFYTEV